MTFQTWWDSCIAKTTLLKQFYLSPYCKEIALNDRSCLIILFLCCFFLKSSIKDLEMWFLWISVDKCNWNFYTNVWQKPHKCHPSHHIVLINFFSLGVMHIIESQPMNIGNFLKSCSLSYLYNLLCQWFSSGVLLQLIMWKSFPDVLKSFH
jgi:hypothetical protein